MVFLIFVFCMFTIIALGFTTVHFWDNGYYVAGNICWAAAAVLAIALLNFM
jgi:hypothetical protein